MDESTSLAKNSQSPKHVPIAGSDRTVVPGATNVGPTDSNQLISVTVVLRRRSWAELARRIDELSMLPPAQKNYMTYEEFAAKHGADPSDVEKIEEFAQEYGLTVERVNTAVGSVVLSGIAASFNKAFGVELGNYQHPDFSYRGHVGEVHVPEYLTDIVTAVVGLDNRPQTSPHFRIYREGMEATPP